jgi:hypothetical protein
MIKKEKRKKEKFTLYIFTVTPILKWKACNVVMLVINPPFDMFIAISLQTDAAVLVGLSCQPQSNLVRFRQSNLVRFRQCFTRSANICGTVSC